MTAFVLFGPKVPITVTLIYWRASPLAGWPSGPANLTVVLSADIEIESGLKISSESVTNSTSERSSRVYFAQSNSGEVASKLDSRANFLPKKSKSEGT